MRYFFVVLQRHDTLKVGGKAQKKENSTNYQQIK
jgi:hypothetical protein